MVVTPWLWTVAVAGVLAALTTPALTHLLRRLDAVAVPNERSSHVRPTVTGAGASIVLATVLAVVTTGVVDVWVLGPAVALGLVGLVDDVRPLPARLRLGLQLGGALVAVAAITWQAGVRGPELVAVVPVAVAVAWVVNAVNFMDGINGITGLHGALFGAVVASTLGLPSATTLGVALVGACLGYLPFNFPRPSSFPGDSAAYFVGMVIALQMLRGVMSSPDNLAAVAVLGPYLTDTVSTSIGRWRAGVDVTTAHRDHTYQRLARRWDSHVVATATFVALSTVASSTAVLVARAPLAVAVLPLAGACVAVLVLRRGLRAHADRPSSAS